MGDRAAVLTATTLNNSFFYAGHSGSIRWGCMPGYGVSKAAIVGSDLFALAKRSGYTMSAWLRILK